MARTNEVLRATGAEAWTTADEIKKMANTIQDTTGRSANDVMAMQDVILGFTSVTDDNFERLTKGIINMADVMGGDLIGQANAFGKALDNPAESLNTLTRYGFKFTEQQKEEIKALEEAGEKAKAQAVILDSMDSAFGKAAEATRKARGAQVDYNNAMSSLKTAVGEAIAPMDNALKGFFATVIKGFADSVIETNKFKAAVKMQKDVDSGAAEWGEGWQGKIKEAENAITRFGGEIKKLQDRAGMSRDGVLSKDAQKQIDLYTKSIYELKALILEGENELRIAEIDRAKAMKEAEKEEKKRTDALKAHEAYAKEAAKSMSQRLSEINKTQEQSRSADMQSFTSYLNSMADLSNAKGADRVIAIQAQEAKILKILELSENQKKALSDAVLAAQTEALKKAEEEEKKHALDEYNTRAANAEKGAELVKRYADLEFEAENASYAQKLKNLSIHYEAEQAVLAERQAALQEMTAADDEWKLEQEIGLNLAMLESDKAYEAAKQKLQEDAAAKEQARNQQRLQAAAALAGSLSSLIKAAGKESVGAAIAAKGLDMAQAAMNTAMAISNALAMSAPPPIPQAMAITAGIAGLAQEVAIASTPIPSAETGGRFLVPQSFTGVDSALMRVNQGEEVNVTPRGDESYGEGGRTVIYLDGQPLVDFVNKKLRSGEIYEISPSWNL
jgi:hypothetical protein